MLGRRDSVAGRDESAGSTVLTEMLTVPRASGSNSNADEEDDVDEEKDDDADESAVSEEDDEDDTGGEENAKIDELESEVVIS